MNLLPTADGRETASYSWRLVARSRLGLVGTAAAFVLAGLCGLVAPWLLGVVVDEVASDSPSSAVVVRVAVAIAVAAVLGGVMTAVAVRGLARTTEPALAELRETVLDRALHLDVARLEEAGTGDLLARVGDDVRTVTTALSEVVPLLLASFTTVVLTAGGLFALDWRLGLAGLATLPLYVLSLRWFLPRSAPYYREERIAEGARAQALVTGLQAARTLRELGRDRGQLAVIEERSDRARQIAVDVFVLATRWFSRNNATEGVGVILILTTGFLLVRSDEVTVGAVTAAALYFHRLFNPVGALIGLFDDAQSAGASMARLVGVATMPARPLDDPDDLPVGSGVVVTGVGHEYEPGSPVLHGISVDVPQGQRVAVVGASGAGKTTLGAVVAGVLAPTSGSVTLGGVEVRDLGPALRRHVAVVTQEVHVLAGTVRENVDVVRPDAGDERVLAVLREVRADGWVAALPDGLDTVVGSEGHALTSTQAQQLALARVLLADPPVVVLDEATAEAGSAGARDLERAGDAVVAGRTALVIAHRLTQARSADRVLVLDAGRVVEDGPHDTLVRAGGVYARLWAAWSGDRTG